MLRHRLFHLSWLSIAVLSLLQISVGRLLHHSPPTRGDDSPGHVVAPAISRADSELPMSPLVIPEQGRPSGRLRGGSSR